MESIFAFIHVQGAKHLEIAALLTYHGRLYTNVTEINFILKVSCFPSAHF